MSKPIAEAGELVGRFPEVEVVVKICADRDGSTATLATLLSQAASDQAAKSLVVFACDENGFGADPSVATILQGVSLPVFGGIFPAIFAGKEVWDQGTIVAALPFALRRELTKISMIWS